ncbi:MAG: bifunctional protein-disulfide isomerase/oxidoreductase DsbC [Colwellia sp.]
MYKKFFFSAVLAAFTLPLFAQGEKPVALSNTPDMLAESVADPAVLNTALLIKKLTKKLGFAHVNVEKSPMPGLALITTEQGLFYSDYNGDFLIQGSLFSLAGEMTNLTEASLAKVRLKGIKAFENDMIIYKAKNEKYVVTAFTDITCGYCRKMHGEMDDYNARGITFRYLAYPRSGIKDRLGNLSAGFKDLRSIWCSENPEQALTKAKLGNNVAYRICDKPVEAQYNFGRQIGVTGTPAIILSNGTIIPGYQPPAQLEQILKQI